MSIGVDIASSILLNGTSQSIAMNPAMHPRQQARRLRPVVELPRQPLHPLARARLAPGRGAAGSASADEGTNARILRPAIAGAS